MPRPAASRAPRRGRRRQAGSGEEAEYLWDENLSHQKYIIPHQEMAKQTGTVSPKLCMNQEFSQTTRAQEDVRSAMEQCLVLGSTELMQEGRQTSAEVGIPSLQLPYQTPGHCGEGPTQLRLIEGAHQGLGEWTRHGGGEAIDAAPFAGVLSQA